MITHSSQTVVRRDVVLPDGLSFRPMAPSDEAFVLSSFRLGQHDKCNLLSRRMVFADAMSVLTEILINVMHKARCVVLCDTNQADSIVGYVIFERQQRKCHIVFLYVKEHGRGLGFASLLYRLATDGMHEDDPVWISSLSVRARNMLDQKKIPWQYKPALLFSQQTFQE